MGGFTKDLQVDYSKKIGSENEAFKYPFIYNNVEYKKYAISNQGYIKNVDTGKYLNAYSYGHNLQCRVYNNGKATTIYIARAVLENFRNICFDKKNNYRIYYKDSDLTNCCIDNLIYEPYNLDKPFKYEYVLYGEYGEVKINGYTVLLDTEFIKNELFKYKFWTKIAKSGAAYFLSTGAKKHSKSLHQLVVEYYRPKYEYYGKVIDHINRNELDCRIQNLRCISATVNSLNRSGKLYSKTPSGYKVSAMVAKKQVNKSFSVADFNNEDECFSAVKKYINEAIIPAQEEYIKQEIERTYYYDLIRCFNYYIKNDNIDYLKEVIKREFNLHIGVTDGQD